MTGSPARPTAGTEPSSQLLDCLREDLAQLQVAAELRRREAHRLTATNAPRAARARDQASRLERQHDQRSDLLEDLTGESASERDLVRLADEVKGLAALLDTEARLRGCRIVARSGSELRVWTNRRRVRKRLFDLLVRELVIAFSQGARTLSIGLSRAGKGGSQ